jgi:hypothetical protein
MEIDGVWREIEEPHEISLQQDRLPPYDYLWQVAVEVVIIGHKCYVGQILAVLVAASLKATRTGKTHIAPPSHDHALERGWNDRNGRFVHVDAH